jgi:signal transduction histidine kinase
VTREFVARRPAWLAVPYLIAGGLAASVCRGFYASPPTMSSLYVAYLFSALAIVVLLACAAYAYYENRHPQVRLQLRSVLPGLTVGTILGLYGFINTADQGGSFPINLIAATPFIFYLSIGYAIARHGLFDVDTLVRQSVVYGTLTLGITVLYTITVALLGRFQVVSGFVGARVLQVVFILVIAAAFAPLRERVQRLVDRTFYRTRVDYAATVRELSAALTSLLDLDDILGRVGRTLSDGLQLVSTTIVLWRERETRIWRYDPGRGRMQEMEAGSLEATRAELARNPQPWLVPDVGSAATVPLAIAAELATFDAALVVPLSLGGHVAGAFVLGRKRSGRPFTRDDIELLSTLAAQSAIAIENAHSYRDLKDLNEQLEHRVRARTADLERSNDELGGAYRELKAAQSQLVQSEKMASLGVLVAGVAHEINNPVSFIVNNMDPLREMVERLRAPTRAGVDPGINAVLNDMTEAIDVIALGAERTAGIVRDLRTFSRLSDQQAQPLDVHEGLEVTLRLLRPRLPDRVTVHRDYGELPPVDSAPGQLNQVFMNVLANACDAVEVAGNVWITTRCDGAVVTVAIRDDGSGIAAEDLGRIFDPFFTTKPQGKGTGLGLALSHGIIEAHGGRLEVQSEVGHGTTVTIIVPVRRPPPPAEG